MKRDRFSPIRSAFRSIRPVREVPILLGLLFATVLLVSACDSNGGMDESGDTTPPQVVRAEAPTATEVVVVFDEALDPASVTADAFTVSNGVGTPARADYLDAARSATLGLSAPMRTGTYSVTVSGVRDAAGNAMAPSQMNFSYPSGTLPGADAAVGAVYPNAADSRIILVNRAGTRFVFWTPSNGSFSDSQPVQNLENQALPIADVGAAMSTRDEEETYFFSTDGESFTIYERESSEFDEPDLFGEDQGDFGDPEIEDVGAGTDVSTVQLVLFNVNGTRYGVWNHSTEAWQGTFNFPADFFGGGAPISAVGAIVFLDEENAYYLFDRDGTQYAIFSGNWSNAFPVTELGDGSLSFN
jgi:hypothetical protein